MATQCCSSAADIQRWFPDAWNADTWNLAAISPLYAFSYIHEHTLQAYIVMGSVVLSVTGVEALYLDMGHFGSKPVRLAWLLVTLPALLANYFGQGALVLSNPQAIDNPFYLMAPE